MVHINVHRIVDAFAMAPLGPMSICTTKSHPRAEEARVFGLGGISCEQYRLSPTCPDVNLIKNHMQAFVVIPAHHGRI